MKQAAPIKRWDEKLLLLLALLALAGLAGCLESTLSHVECATSRDCPGGRYCEANRCVPIPDPDGDLDGEPAAETEEEADASPEEEADADAEGDAPPDGDLSEPDISLETEEETAPDTEPDLSTEEEPELPEAEEEIEIPPMTHGDHCQDPMPLPLDQPVSGNTINMLNDFDPSPPCTDAPLPGPDAVFALVLEAGMDIEVVLQPGNANFNPAIYMIEPCQAPVSACMAASDRGRAGEVESFLFHADTAGTYFLVVDSIFEGQSGMGNFTLAALRREPVPNCAPCDPGNPGACGASANCVKKLGSGGPIEFSCAKTCADSGQCEPGFQCLDSILANGSTGRQCVPAYSDNGQHAVGTCAAFADVGKPCPGSIFGTDDETACGIGPGQAVDDALCYYFFSLTNPVSYCTIYCLDNTECPAGTTCWDVPLSSKKLCRFPE